MRVRHHRENWTGHPVDRGRDAFIAGKAMVEVDSGLAVANALVVAGGDAVEVL